MALTDPSTSLIHPPPSPSITATVNAAAAAATDEMAPPPSRVATLTSNLASVLSRVAAACAQRAESQTTATTKPVRLVAVSKLKPASDILALYNDNGAETGTGTHHRHFGENYVQELLEKSRVLPADIRWHFIGGLQSNKCVTLARDVRGLWAVESVDTEKKASLLDKGWRERQFKEDQGERLRVFVQVNTSSEESKAGVEPQNAATICRFIRANCPRLQLQGLMTIGAIARSRATTPETKNEDLICLRETRDRVVRELGLQGEDALLELSMGMSEDFEGAIVMGSDEVRVGTTIFGERPSKLQTRVTS
jgi:PLP dependent protein